MSRINESKPQENANTEDSYICRVEFQNFMKFNLGRF